MTTPPKTFEDYSETIDLNLRKRRNKWSLTSLSWMDYDDVSQIIRIHIHKKWDKYDQSLPFEPWLNKVISHQIKNLIRNNYSNYARPCQKCPSQLPDEGCTVYESQCDACPLFRNWQKRKKNAFNIKVPVSMEFHEHELSGRIDESTDIEAGAKKLTARLMQVLRPIEKRVYQSLYLDGKSEEVVALELGYTTSETGRIPGYKQLHNIQRCIIEKAKKCLEDGSAEL